MIMIIFNKIANKIMMKINKICMIKILMKMIKNLNLKNYHKAVFIKNLNQENGSGPLL